VQELLAWIEASPLGRIMRESGPWTYALVNLAHILGIASLFGAILVLDLRLLGMGIGGIKNGTARRLPFAPLAAAAVPVARSGFLLAVASGVSLLSANATDYEGNPFLLIKFPAIAIGLVNAVLLGRSTAWHAARTDTATAADARRLAIMSAVSLVSWVTAVAAGRLIGYW
jgi:hypothetical protein